MGFSRINPLAIHATIAFILFTFSSQLPNRVGGSRPLKKLEHPVVIVISSDGFRFGYQYKTHTPNIDRLMNEGTSAELGLIPVFPTMTFPNHYSIATGLYPAYHGIVCNSFVDPVTGETFTRSSTDKKWFIGEPLWETVANKGLKAVVHAWPGSAVKRGSWNCSKESCYMLNSSEPFENKVDAILSHFDSTNDIPSFVALYLNEPDKQGHQYGPDHPKITEAVSLVDQAIGRLTSGLKERGLLEDVDIILVGDHGMVDTCQKRFIFLDELAPWITIPKDWVQNNYELLVIIPKGVSPKDVVSKMNEGLKSGKITNGEHLKVYLKEDLPKRLHYFESDRIAPIIGLVSEGYSVEVERGGDECWGAHGYDNKLFSMRTIFFGSGPHIARNKKVKSFENVEIYNLIAKILDVKGPPNNGTVGFLNKILKPQPRAEVSC